MKGPNFTEAAIIALARSVMVSGNEVVQGMHAGLASNDAATVMGALLGIENHARAIVQQIDAAKALNVLSFVYPKVDK